MAINPAFITCVICGAPHAAPFDFRKTPEQLDEIDAIVRRRREQSARGWSGPQFFDHPTRALLCADHRHTADALGLSEVSAAEGLSRLRGEG